jgi:hypothetical protein
VGTGVTSYPTVFTLADKFSIKPQFVFGTQEAPRIGGCPILCVLGKGWDTRRSVSRFVVSHPSQKTRRMGHPAPGDLLRFLPRTRNATFHIPRVGNAGGRLKSIPSGA